MVASPSLSGKHNNFASRVVDAAVEFKSTFDAMASLYLEWVAEGYSEGNATAIVDGDLTSTNAYLEAANLNAFFVSQQSLATWWGQGHGTNISALLP